MALTTPSPQTSKPRTIVALDVGEKRIGVAIASALTRMPVALTTISVSDNTMATIMEVLNKQEAKVLVIGLPRNLEGNETAQTRSVQKFAEKLQAAGCRVPIAWQDEAVTSVKATEYLQMSGRPFSKEDVDAHAAMIILEDYLSNEK